MKAVERPFAEGGRGGPMVREVPGRRPSVHPDAYVDPAAQVIGDVSIDEGASVWPFSVLRGDQDNYVVLGRNSNVQDNSVLHVTPQHPCVVGAGVTIGHRAVVHACTIMDNVRIGIGAVVLDGAVVEENAQVAAGALVAPGKIVRAGWLVMGVPAQPVRQMSAEEIQDIRQNATDYLELWRRDYRGNQSGWPVRVTRPRARRST
jgi:carbonic anhydrase/acetyltransferase-like protein (isoleucine patch superfamily)